MKKLLLIPALLAGTLAFAEQKKVEISPMIGYNIAEGNLNVKDDGYPVVGIEIQFNTPNSRISPEFSLLYSQGVDYKSGTAAEFKPGQDTKIIRGAFNGVYTFDEMDAFVPFAKLGAGLEAVSNDSQSVEDGFFIDAGAGVKVPFTENLALKLEAIYMAKIATQNSGFADSNLIVMAGLTFAFGESAQKAAPVAAVTPEPVVAPAPTPKPVVAAVIAPVVAAPVVIAVVDGDDDKDGILNSKDSCPATLEGVVVDEKGCDVDSDKDGVLNVNDICPNTLANTKVNSDGCPQTIPLNINFENNSNKIKEVSGAHIQEYADFLTKHTNYNAKIIGYTDSRGKASYNQSLSEKRAAAVVLELTSRGVNSNQLSSEGAGESNPVADNATAEGRAKNRRIEAELTRN